MERHGHKFIGWSEKMMIKVIEDLRQRVNTELETTERVCGTIQR